MMADCNTVRQAVVVPRHHCRWVMCCLHVHRCIFECLCSGVCLSKPQGMRGVGEQFLKEPMNVCCVCISKANTSTLQKVGFIWHCLPHDPSPTHTTTPTPSLEAVIC